MSCLFTQLQINPSIYFLYTERWFLRWKFRQWARLRDANQDGVISQKDMRKTNAKMECLLKLIGARRTVLSAEDQKKWWNDNIFRRHQRGGQHKSIGRSTGLSLPSDMANKARPAIKGKFNFFTTEEYLKKNLIIGEVVLIRFKQTTLRTPTARKCISSTFQQLYQWLCFWQTVSSVSNPDFFDEYSPRVYNVIKPRPAGICE